MYKWKNEAIRCQFDLQKMVAKTNGIHHFTEDELANTNLKSKNFTSIHDPNTIRLIELAYILGSLNGLQTADSQLEEVAVEQKTKPEIIQKIIVQAPVSQEKLYFIACKVKNRQDKTVYTTVTIKASSEKEAEEMAASECGMKNQTLLKCKIMKSYGSDSMQFQFGIGMKELNDLTVLGKKML